MAKHQLIEVLEHRTVKVQIRLDKEKGDGTFYGELPDTVSSSDDPATGVTYGCDQKIEAATLAELRGKLRKEIDDRLDALFRPMIYVYFEKKEDRQHVEDCQSSIELSFTRIYEARIGDKILHREFIAAGAVQEGRFLDEVEGRMGDHTWRPESGPDVTCIEYTPERWIALRRLLKMIQDLQDRIVAELTTPAKLEALLTRLPETLLGAPPKPKAIGHKKGAAK